jgi:hypothetical protein
MSKRSNKKRPVNEITKDTTDCDDDENMCAICLENDLNQTQPDLVIRLQCRPNQRKHCFHKNCLTGFAQTLIQRNEAPFCPLCRQEISDEFLPSLGVKVRPIDLTSEYSRATVPVPPGSFILPREFYSLGSTNINSLIGSTMSVYERRLGRLRVINTRVNITIAQITLDNERMVYTYGFTRPTSIYVDTDMFSNDNVYVVTPAPGFFERIIDLISSSFNERFAQCVISGGKRRTSKRRTSKRRMRKRRTSKRKSRIASKRRKSKK